MGNHWKRVQTSGETSANEWGNECKRMKNEWKQMETSGNALKRVVGVYFKIFKSFQLPFFSSRVLKTERLG